MGARLCLQLALARPELVRGLVLIGGTPGIEDAQARAQRAAADDVFGGEDRGAGGGGLFARVAATADLRGAAGGGGVS
jgi:pimeloyl-ACP methyl ester carboxylesterase